MMNSFQQEPFVAMRREDSKYSPDMVPPRRPDATHFMGRKPDGGNP